MDTGEIIAIIISILIIIGAAIYIIKSKKSGKKCIGCPYSDSCSSGKCSGACVSSHCNCATNAEKNKKKKINKLKLLICLTLSYFKYIILLA